MLLDKVEAIHVDYRDKVKLCCLKHIFVSLFLQNESLMNKLEQHKERHLSR